MSTILLDEAKRFLRVFHPSDDEKIQAALNAAETEALKFMDRTFLPTAERDLPSESVSDVDPVSDGETPSEASAEIDPAVRQGVYLLLKANYDGAEPDGFRGLLDLEAYRKRAESVLMPFRRHLGV